MVLSGRKYSKRGAAMEFINEAVEAPQSDECLVWPFGTSCGYGILAHNGRMWRAHRLVCTLVHGDPLAPQYEAAHSCGVSACVNPGHLRWATPLENTQDKFLHGTVCRGEKITQAKLTVDEVREIRGLRETLSYRDIAKRFGISSANVSYIVAGKTWAWAE